MSSKKQPETPVAKPFREFEADSGFNEREARYLRRIFHVSSSDEADASTFGDLVKTIVKNLKEFKQIDFDSTRDPTIRLSSPPNGAVLEVIKDIGTYFTTNAQTLSIGFLGESDFLDFSKDQVAVVAGLPVYMPDGERGYRSAESYKIEFKPVGRSWLLIFDLDFLPDEHPWRKLYAKVSGEGATRKVRPYVYAPNVTQDVHDTYILSMPHHTPDVPPSTYKFGVDVGNVYSPAKNDEDGEEAWPSRRSLEARLARVAKIAGVALTVLTAANLCTPVTQKTDRADQTAYLQKFLKDFNAAIDLAGTFTAVEFIEDYKVDYSVNDENAFNTFTRRFKENRKMISLALIEEMESTSEFYKILRSFFAKVRSRVYEHALGVILRAIANLETPDGLQVARELIVQRVKLDQEKKFARSDYDEDETGRLFVNVEGLSEFPPSVISDVRDVFETALPNEQVRDAYMEEIKRSVEDTVTSIEYLQYLRLARVLQSMINNDEKADARVQQFLFDIESLHNIVEEFYSFGRSAYLDDEDLTLSLLDFADADRLVRSMASQLRQNYELAANTPEKAIAADRARRALASKKAREARDLFKESSEFRIFEIQDIQRSTQLLVESARRLEQAVALISRQIPSPELQQSANNYGFFVDQDSTLRPTGVAEQLANLVSKSKEMYDFSVAMQTRVSAENSYKDFTRQLLVLLTDAFRIRKLTVEALDNLGNSMRDNNFFRLIPFVKNVFDSLDIVASSPDLKVSEDSRAFDEDRFLQITESFTRAVNNPNYGVQRLILSSVFDSGQAKLEIIDAQLDALLLAGDGDGTKRKRGEREKGDEEESGSSESVVEKAAKIQRRVETIVVASDREKASLAEQIGNTAASAAGNAVAGSCDDPKVVAEASETARDDAKTESKQLLEDRVLADKRKTSLIQAEIQELREKLEKKMEQDKIKEEETRKQAGEMNQLRNMVAELKLELRTARQEQEARNTASKDKNSSSTGSAATKPQKIEPMVTSKEAEFGADVAALTEKYDSVAVNLEISRAEQIRKIEEVKKEATDLLKKLVESGEDYPSLTSALEAILRNIRYGETVAELDKQSRKRNKKPRRKR